MAAHAKLSPSGAYRWLNCPGCIRMSEGLPNESGKHAMTGSIAHCLGEICLMRNHKPEEYIGWWGWDNGKGGNGVEKARPTESCLAMVIKIDETMAENVALYVNTVRGTRKEMPSAEFFVEKKLDLTWLVPDMFGTADHAAVEFMGRAVIDDYKNGFGVVEVPNNPQFMIYALGAIGEGNPHMVEEVLMRVVQPNGIHHQGPVRSHLISVDELTTWGQEVLRPGAFKCLEPDAPVVPGEWCKWCLAKKFETCPAQRQVLLESAKVMFDKEVVPVEGNPALVNPIELTGEQLDRVLAVSGQIASWAKAVEAEAERRLTVGADNAPTSVKMVLGRKFRKWARPEDEVVSEIGKLVEDVYEIKVKSVAQMEKTLKKAGVGREALEGFVDITQGKAMVPVDDKRPAITNSIDEMFK